MKKSILAFCAILMTVASFAKPVSKADLAIVNNSIKQLETEVPGVSLNVVSAQVSDTTGLLSAINLQVAMNDFKFSISLSLEGDALKLAATAEGKAEPGATKNQLIDSFKEAMERKGAEQGSRNYTITSLITSSPTTTLAVRITPMPGAIDPALKELNIKVNVPVNPTTTPLKISLDGTLVSTANEVSQGQVALTNIFKSFLNKSEPTDADTETLGKIISAAMEILDTEE